MTAEDPQVSTQCVTRRTPEDSNSPEFEFWKLRDSPFSHPNLVSADQLFSGGFLLPLQNLTISDEPPPQKEENPQKEPASVADIRSSSSSKRWRQIFRKGDKKSLDFDKDKDGGNGNGKERKKMVITGVGLGVAAAAELNINIWPFSRSRSAGNRPRGPVAPPRKVSSAPCSRSNSTGESKSSPAAAAGRKSPAQGSGVHLGRSSPILKVRRGARRSVTQSAAAGEGSERRGKPTGATSRMKVLNLNVPMCIGYRQQMSCSREESAPIGVVAVADGTPEISSAVAGEELRRSNLLSIRNLFTKKVY